MCQEKTLSPNPTSQFTPHHRNCLSPHYYTLASYTHTHNSSACRGLVTNHLIHPKPLLPVWGQAAVSGTRNGIFVHSDTGAKETRYKIIICRGCAARHNHASRFNVCQGGKIRCDILHGLFRLHFDEVIVFIPTDGNGRNS